MSQFLRQKICLYRLSPVSIDLIEPNLYLGSRSAAEDPETLKKYNITHILTIDDIPLPDEFTKKQNLTTKCICLSDQPREDLLSHLDDTYAFISEGLSKGSVLVHCFFGVSRSASLVIAFIMRKHHMPYERAFEKVRRRRNRVWPNTGFVTQLRLYQEMGYKVTHCTPITKFTDCTKSPIKCAKSVLCHMIAWMWFRMTLDWLHWHRKPRFLVARGAVGFWQTNHTWFLTCTRGKFVICCTLFFPLLGWIAARLLKEGCVARSVMQKWDHSTGMLLFDVRATLQRILLFA